ncbi:MAG: hypothetical protein K2K55_02205 [Duncaniella sp.]|nr:hypothetical protein [Duncaniella sp.]
MEDSEDTVIRVLLKSVSSSVKVVTFSILAWRYPWFIENPGKSLKEIKDLAVSFQSRGILGAVGELIEYVYVIPAIAVAIMVAALPLIFICRYRRIHSRVSRGPWLYIIGYFLIPAIILCGLAGKGIEIVICLYVLGIVYLVFRPVKID